MPLERVSPAFKFEAMTLPFRSLRRNVSSALVGNAVYAACQFAMLAVLAQLTDPHTVGRYALGLAVTTPIFTFFYFKLASLVATDVAEEFEFATYLAHRIIAAMTALATVLVLLAVWQPPLQTWLTMILIACAKMFEAIIDIEYAAMQRRHQLQLIARAQVIRGLGSLVFFTTVLAATASLPWALAAIAVYTAPQTFTSGLQVRKLGFRLDIRIVSEDIRRVTARAFPLGVALTLGAVSLNLPRYLLQADRGHVAVAVYSVQAYFLVASGLIVTSVGQAVSPRIADEIAQGALTAVTSLVRRLVVFSTILGILGVLAVATLGKQVLSVAFGAKYGEEWQAFTILAAAATFQYISVFIGAAVTALRHLSQQVYAAVAQLAATFALCYFLVPDLGVRGAALGTLAGQVAFLLVYVLIYRRAIHCRS